MYQIGLTTFEKENHILDISFKEISITSRWRPWSRSQIFELENFLRVKICDVQLKKVILILQRFKS